ncbi:hypothetical protein [Roseinatronobacter ekhonensis]|jgi:hypothetical protein|nr:hypothetical protein [Roseibaca ekhonensis]
MLGPLEASGHAPDVLWRHHFSWHVYTVAVLAMVVMFALAARRREHVALAGIASAMSAAFAIIGIGLATFVNAALWTTPAPYPSGPIAIIGALDLLLRAKSHWMSAERRTLTSCHKGVLIDHKSNRRPHDRSARRIS